MNAASRPGGSTRGLMVRKSPYSHEETLRRLTDQITRCGLHLFTRIDHTVAAAQAGIRLPPTTVIIFGDPRIGTPIMRSCPDFALELPTRILVRTDPAGATWSLTTTSRAWRSDTACRPRRCAGCAS